MNWFNVNEHKVILYGKIQTISGQIIRKIVFCKQITFKYYQKSLEKKISEVDLISNLKVKIRFSKVIILNIFNFPTYYLLFYFKNII